MLNGEGTTEPLECVSPNLYTLEAFIAYSISPLVSESGSLAFTDSINSLTLAVDLTPAQYRRLIKEDYGN